MSRPPDDDFCPQFHHAVELIGRRWTGVVLRTMLHGASRFCDIAAGVPKLSDKMLAERLKELEAEGMITRTVVPDTPVRIEYGLTDKGRDLEGVLKTLGAWADRWVGPCRGADPPAERPVKRASAVLKRRRPPSRPKPPPSRKRRSR